MIGTSQAMQRICRLARLVAPRDTAVLIVGETGTGKELVASGIHSLSRRSKGPFVVVIAPRFPKACWKPNSSVSHAAPLLALFNPDWAASMGRTAGHSCWMKWANCRSACKPNFCGSCRSMKCSVWVARMFFEWTYD